MGQTIEGNTSTTVFGSTALRGNSGLQAAPNRPAYPKNNSGGKVKSRMGKKD